MLCTIFTKLFVLEHKTDHIIFLSVCHIGFLPEDIIFFKLESGTTAASITGPYLFFYYGKLFQTAAFLKYLWTFLFERYKYLHTIESESLFKICIFYLKFINSNIKITNFRVCISDNQGRMRLKPRNKLYA